MIALYRSGRQADALALYQRVRARLAEDLGLKPGPELRELERSILQQDAALQAPVAAIEVASPGDAASLPAPTTSTIGLEQDIDAISRLLCRVDVRLVTLVGPGGVGKTRLALATASAIKLHFADGACWIELAGVAHDDDVGFTIVQALGIAPLQGERARDALRRVLATRQLLLVIDNFEHVLGAAVLVGELLAACPGVTVLATSRAALDLAAEHRFLVEPLTVPETPETGAVAEVEAASASAMFLAAAARHHPSFAVDSSSAPAVAMVCARLDGLPLAMELAAARTGMLRHRGACSSAGPPAQHARCWSSRCSCPSADAGRDDRVELQPA